MELYRKHSQIFLKSLYASVMMKLTALEQLSHHCNDLGQDYNSDKENITRFSLPNETPAIDFLRVMKSFGFVETRHNKHHILSNGIKSVAISYHKNNMIHYNMLLRYLKEAGLTKCEFLTRYNEC